MACSAQTLIAYQKTPYRTHQPLQQKSQIAPFVQTAQNLRAHRLREIPVSAPHTLKSRRACSWSWSFHGYPIRRSPSALRGCFHPATVAPRYRAPPNLKPPRPLGFLWKVHFPSPPNRVGAQDFLQRIPPRVQYPHRPIANSWVGIRWRQNPTPDSPIAEPAMPRHP